MNSTAFYEARDAVQSKTYLKASMLALLRYRAELTKRLPWEDDPACAGAAMMKADWLATVRNEIEERQKAHWTVAMSIAEKVVAGLILAGFVALVSHAVSSCGSASTEPKQSTSSDRPLAPSHTNPSNQESNILSSGTGFARP